MICVALEVQYLNDHFLYKRLKVKSGADLQQRPSAAVCFALGVWTPNDKQLKAASDCTPAK